MNTYAPIAPVNILWKTCGKPTKPVDFLWKTWFWVPKNSKFFGKTPKVFNVSLFAFCVHSFLCIFQMSARRFLAQVAERASVAVRVGGSMREVVVMGYPMGNPMGNPMLSRSQIQRRRRDDDYDAREGTRAFLAPSLPNTPGNDRVFTGSLPGEGRR